MEIFISLLVGIVLGVVLTKVFGKKVEDTIEADKAELAALEAKYGAEIKNAVGTLSADAQAVVARYHALKAKVEQGVDFVKGVVTSIKS